MGVRAGVDAALRNHGRRGVPDMEQRLIQARGKKVPGPIRHPPVREHLMVGRLFRHALSRRRRRGHPAPLGDVLALTIMFMRITRAAGWLMVPYLAWVTFASALNIGVAVMN